jgi:hypothetical protein
MRRSRVRFSLWAPDIDRRPCPERGRLLLSRCQPAGHVGPRRCAAARVARRHSRIGDQPVADRPRQVLRWARTGAGNGAGGTDQLLTAGRSATATWRTRKSWAPARRSISSSDQNVFGESRQVAVDDDHRSTIAMRPCAVSTRRSSAKTVSTSTSSDTRPLTTATAAEESRIGSRVASAHATSSVGKSWRAASTAANEASATRTRRS